MEAATKPGDEGWELVSVFPLKSMESGGEKRGPDFIVQGGPTRREFQTMLVFKQRVDTSK